MSARIFYQEDCNLSLLDGKTCLLYTSPDNIFKGSYEGASSTGSGQQIHKKAVFFDADGTICDIEKGTPASAVEAITKLVKNGHQAWLCTGRSRAFVPDYLR